MMAKRSQGEGPIQGNPSGPCVMVIMGAGGDLTKRKLVPALYNLEAGHLLSKNFALVGFARRDYTHEAFREAMDKELRHHAPADFSPEVWGALLRRLYFVKGDFGDQEAFGRLRDLLANIARDHGTEGNILFYLATPPSFFSGILHNLGEAGLTDEEQGRWRRVIIEKPFGRDLQSACALNRDIQEVLHESQIYRIDHYLGKETVQNMLVFRFSNGIFEPIWNRRYIDHVQITVAETLGVEQRGGYYDTAGALRDMVPNHLFQLLALTAMEPPISFEANAVRDERGKVLNAIQPISPDEVLTRTVRGQYGEGALPGAGKAPAYRSEVRVDPESATETYAAIKVMVDNWRWADVPFYVRTGKRLAKRLTEVAIQFRRVPFALFRETPVDHLTPNRLILRIQPEEGIALSFGAKIPGPTVRMGNVKMNFSYSDYFSAQPTTGYETLLYDCMNGDATLFMRADNVETAWRVVTPILDVWGALKPRNFPDYAPGSWGPAKADELLSRDGRAWRKPD